MGTKIHMSCDGCDKETSVDIRRTFHSFNGNGFGFGVYHVPSIDEAVDPTGWVWADMIGCTYCPECWKEIEANSSAGQDTASQDAA